MARIEPVVAHAACDGEGLLLSADEPLAGLQLRCGGVIPGEIAVPALRMLVARARRFGLKLARPMVARDGAELIRAWVEVAPGPGDGGCAITLRNWQATPLPPEDAPGSFSRRAELDRVLAGLTAHLDSRQRVLAVECDAPDLASLAATMRAGLGRAWTDFVTFMDDGWQQPIHWRLADGASILAEGSARVWRVALVPQALHGDQPTGFELCLNSDTLLAPHAARDAGGHLAERPAPETLDLGREVAPVLRQPIARIIANAETIHLRLAGPLQEEYSRYAGDIAAAGQHMLELVDDLADLDVVEADGFTTAADHIDLADAVRRAAGILSIRAREKGIGLEVPGADEHLPAIAEFRRVLQVLLNLIGNAIRYSTENTPINAIRYTPDNPPVRVTLERAGARARVIVADSGQGLSADEQARVFEKFERLGRAGDGGSGLGLYISRRLARAMGGDLTVESAKGEGARFILEVPADLGV